MTTLLTVLGGAAGIALLLIMALTPLFADQPRRPDPDPDPAPTPIPVPAQRRPPRGVRTVTIGRQAVGPRA